MPPITLAAAQKTLSSALYLGLSVLGVADGAALAMILFNNIFSILLMVGIGLMVFWLSGVELGTLTRSPPITGR